MACQLGPTIIANKHDNTDNTPTETTKRIQYVGWSDLYIASTVLVLVKKIELANIVIIRVPQCSISIRVPQYPVGYNNMAD
jgi:hypothetical protein